MSSALRIAALAYLAACLLAGGSAQGVWNNLLLQLSGLALIAWSLSVPSATRLPATGRQLTLILAAMLAWIALQLVPLPPALWTAIPGRALIAQGFAVAGHPLPWQPLSLTPDAGIATALAAIPAVAMLIVTLRDEAASDRAAALVILAIATAGILLGLVQLGGDGSYVLYPVSNAGSATGFFANSNHMAALLLVAIPFFVALVARLPGSMTPLRWLAVAAGAAVLLTGIVTNGSFAILLLGAPVALASGLLAVPPGKFRVGRMVLVTGALAIAGVAALLVSALSGLSGTNLASVTIRQDIWTNSLALIRDFGLVGSGLGSFPSLYPLSEDPNAVDWFYINHAHNDFLELIVELGVPGVLLIAAFLWWWIARTVALWRRRESVHLARAASIASGALLLHSLVDFPLRTGALAAVFGLCLALMVVGGAAARSAGSRSSTGARHLTLADLD